MKLGGGVGSSRMPPGRSQQITAMLHSTHTYLGQHGLSMHMCQHGGGDDKARAEKMWDQNAASARDVYEMCKTIEEISPKMAGEMGRIRSQLTGLIGGKATKGTKRKRAGSVASSNGAVVLAPAEEETLAALEAEIGRLKAANEDATTTVGEWEIKWKVRAKVSGSGVAGDFAATRAGGKQCRSIKGLRALLAGSA